MEKVYIREEFIKKYGVRYIEQFHGPAGGRVSFPSISIYAVTETIPNIFDKNNHYGHKSKNDVIAKIANKNNAIYDPSKDIQLPDVIKVRELDLVDPFIVIKHVNGIIVLQTQMKPYSPTTVREESPLTIKIRYEIIFKIDNKFRRSFITCNTSCAFDKEIFGVECFKLPSKIYIDDNSNSDSKLTNSEVYLVENFYHARHVANELRKRLVFNF